jgi:hypothetical protein
MKRNLILAIVVLLLGSGAYYAYKNRPDSDTNLDRAESNFKIDDLNTIGRILLTHKDGTRADLKRSGDHWTINDNYKARQSTMEVLLAGIQTQSLDHIPSAAATKNILPYMISSGIHVEIFDRQGKPLLGYYVGGVSPDEHATYFMKEGSSQPYALIQPGFDGSLRVRYSLNPIDWRDVRFWTEDNDKIDTLIVDYPKQHQYAFKIYKKGAGYTIDPLYRTTPILKKENETLIRSYFTSLSQLACEDFINDAPERDSILQMEPFVHMQIVYPDKRTNLRFYPIGTPARSEFSPSFNRFFIDYEGRDFMLAQYNVIKGAFRSYDYFFPEQ